MLPDLDVGATQTALRAVQSSPDLSFMGKLLAAANVSGALDNPLFAGTLLAPSDGAFKAFAEKMGYGGGAMDEMLLNGPLAAALVSQHLLAAPRSLDALLKDAAAAPVTDKTFGGGSVTFEAARARGPTGLLEPQLAMASGGGRSSASCARVLDAGRSYVHVIDSVLLPPGVFFTIRDALAHYKPTRRLAAALLAGPPALAAAARDARTNVTFFAPADAAPAGATDAPDSARLPAGGSAADAAAGAAVAPRELSSLVVPGARFIPRDVRSGAPLAALDGTLLAVTIAVDAATRVGTIYVGPAARGATASSSSEAGGARAAQINVIAGRSVIHGLERSPFAAGGGGSSGSSGTGSSGTGSLSSSGGGPGLGLGGSARRLLRA